jgi:excisionase family DNA binding protein
MVLAEGELVVSCGTQSALAEGEDARATFGELADELQQVDHAGEPRMARAKLVSPDGQTVVELPPRIYRALHFVVHHMARGDSISLMLLHRELTTQRAADLLNVSRPFLIKLLDAGEIPYRKTGKHRRVKLVDLLAYRERRKREADAFLTEMAQEAQDMGLY